MSKVSLNLKGLWLDSLSKPEPRSKKKKKNRDWLSKYRNTYYGWHAEKNHQVSEGSMIRLAPNCRLKDV